MHSCQFSIKTTDSKQSLLYVVGRLNERTQILTAQTFINGFLVTQLEYISLSFIMVIQVHSLQNSHEEAVLVSIPDKSQLSTSGPMAVQVQQLTFDPSAHHKQSLQRMSAAGKLLSIEYTHTEGLMHDIRHGISSLPKIVGCMLTQQLQPLPTQLVTRNL